MRKAKGEYAIQCVSNAMRLLEEFRNEDELGVTELSRRLELHKNNVFRLLATLEQGGYIEQSADTERYRLGVAVLELGSSLKRSRSLLTLAEPVLDALVQATRETCHLAVLHDFEVVHMRGRQSERPVMAGLREGRRLPAHCTALGKVLVACAPQVLREAYDRWIGEHELEAYTDNTIVDRDKLIEHLRGVGVRGLALDLGECDDGLACAAAPVHGAEGELVAAISVSGPMGRLDEDRIRAEVVPHLTQSSEQLSRSLGYAV